MTIDEITDHADQIKARYPSQFDENAIENKNVNLAKLIDIIGGRVQELETQFFKLLDERHLSVAVGVQLDGIGQILNLARDVGEVDESYRARLVGRTGELAKSGEIESLISTFMTLTQAAFAFTDEFYPAGFTMVAHLDADAEDSTIDQAIVDQMNLVKAGGVKLILEFAEETEYFELSRSSETDANNNGPDSSDHGLGHQTLTEGGGLARVIR
jgi:hypothetical protein